jgi:hypothetical protein
MHIARIRALLRGLDPQTSRILEHALTQLGENAHYGIPADEAKAENFSAYFLYGRTHATPSTEFAITHRLETAPHLAIPCLPLGEAGAKMVDLTVTRKADERFIYLSSSVADAPFWLLVEA